MGMFDRLLVKCPTCEGSIEFQSKAGRCDLDEYTLEDCPLIVLADVVTQPSELCPRCGNNVSVGIAYTATVLVGEQSPYLMKHKTTTEREYNPHYGDSRVCECGHTYYRHFDSGDSMAPVGCKYCECSTFIEQDAS